jgi:hypothetical protein
MRRDELADAVVISIEHDGTSMLLKATPPHSVGGPGLSLD